MHIKITKDCIANLSSKIFDFFYFVPVGLNLVLCRGPDCVG